MGRFAVVEYEIHGIKVMVEEKDLSRLTRFVHDASAALRDQPELLTRLDSVERQAVAVRKMTDSVVMASATLLNAVEGQGAVKGLIERLEKGTNG